MSKKVRRVPSHHSEELILRIFQDHDYTSVVIEDAEGIPVGMGSARRDPSDEVDLEIGGSLALGRAFEDVGRRSIKRAEGLIKHADDVKSAKAAAKAEREGEYSFSKVWDFFTNELAQATPVEDVELTDVVVAQVLLGLFDFLLSDVDIEVDDDLSGS